MLPANKTNFWGMRIRLLLLVGFSTLPLYFLILSNYFSQRAGEYARVREETQRVTTVARSTQESLVEGTGQYLAVLAQLPEILPENPQVCNTLMENILAEQLPRYANFGVASLDGNIYCSGLPLSQKTDISDRLYFRRALEEQAFSVGEYQIGRITNRPSVNFGYPVTDDEGELVAIAYAALDLTWLGELAQTVDLPQDATINLLDEQGTVLVRYPDQSVWLGKDASDTDLMRMLREADTPSGFIEAGGLDNEDRLYYFERIHTESGFIYLFVGYPLAAISASANAILWRNILALGVFTSVGVLLAAFLSERMVIRPAKRLAIAEERLRTQVQRDRAILSSIGEGLIATDNAGRITMINSRALTMLDRTEKEAQGTQIFDLVTMVDEHGQELPVDERPMNQALTTRNRIRGLYQYKTSPDRVLPVALTVTPIISEGEVIGSIEVFRDVTKEREVDRMKSEFISLASHQLKAPLTAMRWYSEMLLAEDGDELTQEQQEIVETIHTSNLRMTELVNTLLNISRIESGRLIVEPKPTQVQTVIDEILTEVQPKLTERNQELTVKIADDVPEIQVDPGLLRQVYLNLITNASKYSPEGSEIQLAVQVEGSMVQSSVRDQGYGIPAEEHHRVFQKFYRGTNILKHESEGTGLGLYLVKVIVETMGGEIWFESAVGTGTTFFFTLPVAGVTTKPGDVGLS